MLAVDTNAAKWSRQTDVRRPFHVTNVANRSLFVGGRKVEADLGLAPSKTWVAVTRLDDFAISAVINRPPRRRRPRWSGEFDYEDDDDDDREMVAGA